LVLEHAPHTLYSWLGSNQSSAEDVVDQLLSTVAFLHAEGVFHFDAHYGNVVTDGATTFLTDFGLVCDRAFHLSEAERAFLDGHAHYDHGEVLYSLAHPLFGLLSALADDDRKALLRRYRPEGPLDEMVALEVVLENLQSIVTDGSLGVSASYAAIVERYREVILFMGRFFSALRANRRKNTPFDDRHLRSLLVAAGVVR
jgi:hypothetical protein